MTILSFIFCILRTLGDCPSTLECVEVKAVKLSSQRFSSSLHLSISPPYPHFVLLIPPHGLLRRIHRPYLLQSFLLSRQVQSSNCFRPLFPNPSSSQIFPRSSQILPTFRSSFLLLFLLPWNSF